MDKCTDYNPDTQAQCDCLNCGQPWEAHQVTDRKQALIDLKAKVEAGDKMRWTEFLDAFPLNPNDKYLYAAKAYDGSVDAALSLLEAVLPGWDARVFKSGSAWIYKPTRNAPPDMESEACVEDQPARALLLAILSALISQA